MKKIMIVCTLVLLQHFAWAGTDSLTALKVLNKVQENIRQVKTLVYSSAYRQVNSEMDDSVFTAAGKIWFAKNNADTIFGGGFHISGADGNGAYDYYYDGQKSYEMRHADKKLTIIYPANFENNNNNPAKARTALLPFLQLMLDTAIVKTMMEDNPAVKMEETNGEWLIAFAYPPNKYGAVINLQLFVDKQTYYITKVARHGIWNGTNFSSLYTITGIAINSTIPNDSINLSFPPAGYAITEIKAKEKSTEPSPLVYFKGRKAPLFSYPSLNGEKVQLKNRKAKYVLIDFWESWCGYCILAIPKIEKLYNQYHAKGLYVIGVTTENIDQIKKIVQRNNLTYPTVVGDKKILDDYKVSGRPTYVLIDANGKIVDYATGDLDKITATIEEGLGAIN